MLALCLLHAGRRDARTDDAGLPVLLEGQDETRWDAALLDEGRAAAAAALAGAPAGRFALQAALAAAHLRRPAPDWGEVVRLYARLLAVWDSPAVALNAAAALGLARGPVVGLAALDRLADDPVLRRSHYLPAARAELLVRLGDLAAADVAYAAALRLVGNDAERRHLERRRVSLPR